VHVKPYSRYKRSGVEWLGDVPEHWDALPLKRRHRVVNGGTPSSGEENYWDGEINWITPEDLGKNETKRIGSSRRTLSLDGLQNCGAQLVPRDSIVLSTRAPIGHIAVTDRESCTNQGCRALVPTTRRTLADFVYYSLVASRPVLQASGKGTTFMELAAGALGAHAVPFPPADEQRAIAHFLDRETVKLDTLVEKKRALIEKLKEKRTTLISRTVTRGLPPDAARAAGLNPNPKLKLSGVEWYGDVLDDWAVKPLKRGVRFLEGPGIMAADFLDEGVPLLRIAGIGGRTATLEGCNYLSSDLVKERWSHFRVRRGDLLISGSASTGFCSEVDEVTEGAVPYTGIIIIRPRPQEVEKDFIRWFCLSDQFLTQANLARTGSTIQHFGPSHLSRMVIALPPLTEQRVIAHYLDRETAKIDRMVEKVEAAIERLREYRVSLITAAVTGKIDVRGETRDNKPVLTSVS